MGVWVVETLEIFRVSFDLCRFEQVAISEREVPTTDGHDDVYIQLMIMLELRVLDMYDTLPREMSLYYARLTTN